MAELVQLELDEKDKENFAEMQAAMNEAQRELASLTMRGRTRHAEAKCVQRHPMRSRRCCLSAVCSLTRVYDAPCGADMLHSRTPSLRKSLMTRAPSSSAARCSCCAQFPS